MLRVPIHSRRGNAVLGFLGVVYAVAAAVLLVWHVRQTWGAAGLVDRAIQVMLIGTILAGIWFVFIAAGNLGMFQSAAAEPPLLDRKAVAAPPHS